MSIQPLLDRSPLGAAFIRYGIALLIGAFTALSCAPYFQIYALFLGFAGFTLFFIYRQNQSRISKAAEAHGFGFGFHLGGLHWIGNALMTDPEQFGMFYPVAIIGLPFALAFFYAVPALALRREAKPYELLFTLPILLAAGDLARGFLFTGFPWNLPVYGLGFSDIFIQSAYPLGIYPLNFLVIFLACLPAGFFIFQKLTEKITLGILSFGTVGAAFFYGKHRLDTGSLAPVSAETFVIVQPNIEQKLKWAPEERNHNFTRLLELTRNAAKDIHAQNKKAKIVTIWPETALQLHPERDMNVASALSRLGSETGEIITGKMRFAENPADPAQYFFYNSLLQISDDGKKFHYAYDKIKLVPFGEYLPLASILNNIGFKQINHFQSAFTPGAGYSVVQTAGGAKAAPLICYEIIFPDFVKAFAQAEKPNLLLNLTNDAWFGNSAGPHQHLTQARFRAVENGITVLRAANTGISAEIDPFGRIKQQIPFGKAGVLTVAPHKINF